MKEYKYLSDMKAEMLRIINEAYDRGAKDGIKSVNTYDDDLKAEAYKKGLDDAWEAARKISYPFTKGGFSTKEIKAIFKVNYFYDVLADYSASEAIAKIKEYKEKQKQDDEIKVGDEVIIEEKDTIAVVVNIDEPYISVLTSNANYEVWGYSGLKKTGKHFDYITDVLSAMKERK